MTENRSRGIESVIRSLTTLPRSTRCLTMFDFHSYSTNRNPKQKDLNLKLAAVPYATPKWPIANLLQLLSSE